MLTHSSLVPLTLSSLLALHAAAQSQVYLTSSSTAVETLFPPSPPGDYHAATVTTNPALLAGTTITSTNAAHTGGNTNGISFGAIGRIRARSYAYEPYGYNAQGDAILAGGTASDNRAQFTEYLPLHHPTLPVGTPVTITATFAINGSRTEPDAGNAGAFSTYAVGTVAIGDGANSVASPTWSSSPPHVNGRVLVISLVTELGRTLFVTGQLQTSSSINHNAILVRSLEADYSGRVTLASSIPDVNLTGVSGHDFAEACTGDLNADNFVDDNDFIIFAAAYNILDCADPSMPAGCPSDLNADAIVDDLDFQVFVLAYNVLVCE